jgi:cyanophycinase
MPNRFARILANTPRAPMPLPNDLHSRTLAAHRPHTVLHAPLSCLLALLSCVVPLLANDDAGAPPRGSLLIHGGGGVDAETYQAFRERSGGDSARLVVIPTAGDSDPDPTKIAADWKDRGFSQVTLLHTRDRQVADTPEFVAPLQSATAVWIGGGQQSRLSDAYAGTRVERELQTLYLRGGCIAGTSAGAAIMTRVMIASGTGEPNMGTGFDLLPGCIVDQHFLARDRLGRLQSAVLAHPDRIGVGIDEKTALLVGPTDVRVLGPSYVLLFRVEPVTGRLQLSSLKSGDPQSRDLLRCEPSAASRP